jgi:hypothetical protein
MLRAAGTAVADPAVQKQAEAFKAAQKYVKDNPQALVNAVPGPGGKLTTGGGAPCGQSFPRAEVLTDGVMIPLYADVGTGPQSDTAVYQYTIYEKVTDPSGKTVAEGSNAISTKNVPFPPEFGYILLYESCPVVGVYTIEQFLFVANSSGLSLLDRKKCTFTVTQ